jgi:hypothetical protein
MCLAAVRDGDRLDDRQTKAAAVGRRRLGTAESLERTAKERVREAGAVVEHVQFDRAVPCLRRQRHRSASVTAGVVGHVAERLLEPQTVSVHDERLGLDMSAEAVRDIAEEICHVDGLHLERNPALLCAGEQQQVLGQARESLGAVRGRTESLAQLVRRTSAREGELELSPEQCERRPQLVTRVGGEPALAGETGLDPRQHRVERLTQA